MFAFNYTKTLFAVRIPDVCSFRAKFYYTPSKTPNYMQSIVQLCFFFKFNFPVSSVSSSFRFSKLLIIIITIVQSVNDEIINIPVILP